ncbi:MAG: pyridoxine 5'-phosphate synthase [Candidatus Hydrogenedentes bacterium]|jgi:pyridoxine 5-phosphate synthase|nr:pyridoxine 5'-phosphate synthase [Candidatus Hydrogenedentota bacterium]
MTKLSVNLNKVALLRNARDVGYPSVSKAAATCIRAGCHGITVHPRPDERHIRRSDAHELVPIVADVEFNIEGNPFPEFMELVREAKPTQCTLVPDDPDQNTSDHGWDLTTESGRVGPLVEELNGLGIRVSLFLDPVEEQVRLAGQLGADRIELYTEPYASAFAAGNYAETLAQYTRAAELAAGLGLGTNAGHDLTLDNLGPFLRTVPRVAEVSIGHALISDALDMGLDSAVRAYLDVLKAAV